jgi:hypothetical protein
VERLLADVRGLRRGTVSVEPLAPATPQPFPEVSVEECIEECFLAIEAVASSWDRGIFPKPSADRIERISEAVFAAASALGASIVRPVLSPAHFDAE